LNPPWDIPDPSWGPNLTVSLNALSTVLLIAGYRAIRGGKRELHKRIMLGALASSAAFLTVYLWHHALHGSTRYPFHDWTYTLYLLILIPHIILATLVVPFVLRGVYLAWRERFEKHARLMRYVWPVWLYVSITGVLVYLMLYIFPGWR
jgi:putative membrane protein